MGNPADRYAPANFFVRCLIVLFVSAVENVHINMDKIKHIYNTFARVFDTMDCFSVARKNREAAIKTIKKVMKLSQKTVLDIGCGTGTWGSMFAQAGAVVSGIDFSENMIDIARRKYPTRHFEVLAANQLCTFPDKSFDIVTSSFVLHDILQPERSQVLREMSRVMKEWVFIFDYGAQKIPFMPTVFEFVEGNLYKSFVAEIDDDLQNIYQLSQKHSLLGGGAVYCCR